MEKALKHKKFFLKMGIVSSVIAIATAFVSWLLVGFGIYIPLIPLFLASAYGFYSAPFYFFYSHDAKEAIRLLAAIDVRGVDNIRDLALDMGWRRRVTRKFIEKCRKRGYILPKMDENNGQTDNSTKENSL